MTQVQRSSRCIVAHRVVAHRVVAHRVVAHRVVATRTEDDLRAMIWQEAPSARAYYNDAFALYDTIGYPGEHQSLPNKTQTYSVEGDNAEIRHYLARLARKSRCFTRCLEALQRAIDLFVFFWNRRQRCNRMHPRYKKNLQDFIMPI